METEQKCIRCQRSSQEVPLLVITYNGVNYYICPQDLPVLIHKPYELMGLLPGVENLSGHEH